MSRNLLVVLALAVTSLAVADPAHAVLITVNFTVTGAAGDPLHAGETASGSFSFDSSIIPGTLPGSVPLPAVTNFNLTWDGTSWTDANTSGFSPESTFDAAGNLVDWRVGGDPSGADTFLIPGPDDIALIGGLNRFAYFNEGSNTPYSGTLTWTVDYGTGGAPEPGTLALFAPALLALGLILRRRS